MGNQVSSLIRPELEVAQAHASFSTSPGQETPSLPPLLQLQQKLGNQAIGRMLQPKLTVNQPGDRYEQEADQVAERVMRMPESILQRKTCACGKPAGPDGMCEDCKRKQLNIQRKAAGEGGETAVPLIVHQALQQSGRPLDSPTRHFMEARFGRDFSQVRIHTNEIAANSADFVNARAYTVGQDMVFGAGQYRPGTAAGRMLLAHELTHTIQQGPGKPSLQRAMKFEIQTRNYVWQVDKKGKNPKPLGRKLGREGYSEDGSKPTFLAVGKQGYPEIKAGNLIKAKVEKKDKEKPGQYVQTYRVTRDPKGKFTLDDKQVSVTLVSEVDNSKVKEMQGKYNKGIYEFTYLDGDKNDEEMDVHRDPAGNLQYGKIKRMRKATKKDVEEGTAIELQSESRGFLEFETPKWFSNWCALRLRIREAYEMTKAISNPANNINDEALSKSIEGQIPALIKAGNRYKNHDKVGRLVEWPSEYPTDKLPLKGGRLIVEIVKGDQGEKWEAYIQASEGISLTQFESLLKEHVPTEASRAVLYADEILKEGKIERGKAPNLYSFLQMIAYYIESGQSDKHIKEASGDPGPAKWAFTVMSRTSFSSIYSTLLTPDEKLLFTKLVKSKKILTAITKANPKLVLKADTKFWVIGHGGEKNSPLTIMDWLKSIIEPDKYNKQYKREGERYAGKDLLSPPKSGSAAMGRFEVEKEAGKDDTNLVKFEMRIVSGNRQYAAKWEEYAEKLFKKAAESRKRDDGTGLVYEKSEKCADSYFEHQKDKDEKKKPPASQPAKAAPINYQLVPKLTLKLGDEKKLGFDADFRLMLPSWLDGKLRPFVLGGIGTDGLSVGGGLSAAPVNDLPLFLAGKAAIRTDWFKSVEIGGGLEAAWGIDKSRSLRLGIGWDIWQELGTDQKREHLLNVFLSKQL